MNLIDYVFIGLVVFMSIMMLVAELLWQHAVRRERRMQAAI
jgi:hypothetical protein